MADVSMRDCSGALFLSRFFRDKKKRERKARPVVFTEGHALILSFIVLELSKKKINHYTLKIQNGTKRRRRFSRIRL